VGYLRHITFSRQLRSIEHTIGVISVSLYWRLTRWNNSVGTVDVFSVCMRIRCDGPEVSVVVDRQFYHSACARTERDHVGPWYRFSSSSPRITFTYQLPRWRWRVWV